MRVSNVILIVVALAFGVAAAYTAQQWLESQARRPAVVAQPQRMIVVARAKLAYGTALTDDVLGEIPWAAPTLPEGAFGSKAELLNGGRRAALAAFERNEPILNAKITGPGQRATLSSMIEEGMRAVTLRVDDVRGVAGFVLPGDRVDVVIIRTEQDQAQKGEGYSEVLLQNVKVLAVDQVADERTDRPAVAKAVTLSVTAQQAQKALLASSVGRISLILRQSGESAAEATQRVTVSDLSQSEVASRQADLTMKRLGDIEGILADLRKQGGSGATASDIRTQINQLEARMREEMSRFAREQAEAERLRRTERAAAPAPAPAVADSAMIMVYRGSNKPEEVKVRRAD